VARIIEDVQKVQRGLNKGLRIFGIVPVMVQANTSIAQIVLSQARENYPKLMLPLEIKLSVKFVNASLEGVPLVLAEPKHPGAQEYMQLVDLVIQRLATEAEHG